MELLVCVDSTGLFGQKWYDLIHLVLQRPGSGRRFFRAFVKEEGESRM